jgi:glucosylceramidase
MNKIKVFVVLIILLTSISGKGIVILGNKNTNPDVKSKTAVALWLTSPATNVLFQLQKQSLIFGNLVNQDATITVDSTQTFQPIDGFGNCLTGGSATLLHKMDAKSRSAILKELFATDGNNIGISYLRINVV